MRLLFFGSGEFGSPTLRALHERHDVAAVVSQPDRPAGRKRRLRPTPVAAWAQKQGLAVLKPEHVNRPAVIDRIKTLKPEASVVVAFGQKLSPPLVEAMGPLAVNLHASLLPAYRGAAPINWAIIRGERVSGVSVIALAQRMDAGEVFAQNQLEIKPTWTAGELHDQLASLGPRAIEQVLADLRRGTLAPQPQDEAQATRAPKLSKAEGTVGFDQPAEAVRARIHGLTPWPGCRVRWRPSGGGDGDGQENTPGSTLILRRARAHQTPKVSAAPGTVLEGQRVATAGGAIELLEVQAAGGKPMSADAFARGHDLVPGHRLEPLTPQPRAR